MLDGGRPAPVRDRRRGGPAEPDEPAPRGRRTQPRDDRTQAAGPRDDRTTTTRAGRAEPAAPRAGRAEPAAPRAGRAERAEPAAARDGRPRSAAARDERGRTAADPAPDRRTAGARTPAAKSPKPAAKTAAKPAAKPAGKTTAKTTALKAPARPAGKPPAPKRAPGAGVFGRRGEAAPPRQSRGRAGDAPPRAPMSRKRPAPAAPPPPPRLADHRRRLRVGTVVALAMFVIIGARLVVLQVVNTPAYADSINAQRQNRLAKVALPAPRGAIYDRDGSALARSIEARYVYADPELVKNPAGVAATLSPMLGMPISELRPKLERSKRPGGGWSRFEYLARGVDVRTADEIKKLNLAGIGTHRDERRDVPGADLAANLIGFTGADMAGLEGLEARYDGLLRGRDGQRVFEQGNPHVDKGQLAKEIPGGFRQETPAQRGSSLVLTIDNDLQFMVQRILGERMTKLNASFGAAVVLDVKTGEVLAQASYPAYNAAQPFQAKPTDREDAASSIVVDPGSVHKALIFGAALEENLVEPDSTLVVGPALIRGGARFQDTHPHPKNTRVTLPGLLAYSSNVGTIRLGDMLGPERIYAYQQKFGLGQPTGEGVAGEAAGRLLAPAEWSGSASGAVPVGHSVDATLIQMAAAYAAIANGGVYVQPHLIKETIDGDGRRVPAAKPATHRVLSADNAAALRLMMEAVVSVKGATGNLAAIDGYRVAGKTGTGRRVVDGEYTDSEVGSFIGMAPAEDPRYVVAVLGDTPGGGGGVVGGPAFKDMMSFTLAHYRVPPSGTKPPQFTIVP